jgi:hypothetical protein
VFFAKRDSRKVRLSSQAAEPPIHQAAGAVPTHGATAPLGSCGASGEPAAPADLASQAVEAEDGVKLDRVRRHTGLAVLEVKECDGRDLRAAAQPNK